jgi:hypothetical protein
LYFNLLLYSTRTVPSGFYVTKLCIQGNFTSSGEDLTFNPCNEAAEGTYISTACFQGMTMSAILGKQCHMFFFQCIFLIGGATGLGRNSVISDCSLPTPGTFIAESCQKGTLVVSGVDTHIQRYIIITTILNYVSFLIIFVYKLQVVLLLWTASVIPSLLA